MMLLTMTIGILAMQPAMIAPQAEKLKLRVAVTDGSGWDLIRQGGKNKDSFRELVLEMLREDGRFDVAPLTLPKAVASGSEDLTYLLADVFLDPVVISAKQTTDRQRVPDPIRRLGGGIASGSVATSTAEVQLKLVSRTMPTGPPVTDTQGSGKHSASSIDVYNRETGHIDVGDLRKTDIGVAVERAVKEALKDFGQGLEAVKWRAVVAAVDESGRVVINRGKGSGLKPGMSLRVMELSPPLFDPISGDMLKPGEERETARLKVLSVDALTATCEVTSGDSVAVRNIVRQ
jgi:hypothetical protein